MFLCGGSSWHLRRHPWCGHGVRDSLYFAWEMGLCWTPCFEMHSYWRFQVPYLKQVPYTQLRLKDPCPNFSETSIQYAWSFVFCMGKEGHFWLKTASDLHVNDGPVPPKSFITGCMKNHCRRPPCFTRSFSIKKGRGQVGPPKKIPYSQNFLVLLLFLGVVHWIDENTFFWTFSKKICPKELYFSNCSTNCFPIAY